MNKKSKLQGILIIWKKGCILDNLTYVCIVAIGERTDEFVYFGTTTCLIEAFQGGIFIDASR
jgi:hypothetical protein